MRNVFLILLFATALCFLAVFLILRNDGLNQESDSFDVKEERIRGHTSGVALSEELETPTLAESVVGGEPIIEAAVNWLKQAQEPNGHFRYQYSLLADSYSDEDLMVRQTGALYILAEALRNTELDKYALKETIEKAISYFKNNSVSSEFNDYKFRCVLRNSTICSLGGTSLTLIGILDLLEKYPELKPQYENLIADYLNFILAMKMSGVGFRGFYYLTSEQTETESDFSSGEAFLALARYYTYNPIEKIKVVIDSASDYFIEKYSKSWNFNFYLWGMAAVKELYKTEPEAKYLTFVKDYTDWRVSSYKNRRDITSNVCAYIEGVISAYSVFESSLAEQEKGYYLEEINFWLGKSRELQVGNTGFVNLRFGGQDYSLKLLNLERAAGGFLTGLDKPFQRIDYTQHCLSSYLQRL